MYQIGKFLSRMKYGETLEDNDIIQGQRATLESALAAEKGSLLFSACEEPTEWTLESAMTLFKEIGNAGYCQLNTLPKTLRKAGISLMQHNILHYRPVQPIVEDIEGMRTYIRQ